MSVGPTMAPAPADSRLAQDSRVYKAKIASVAPESMRNSYGAGQGCFLGVSLENPNFHPAKMAAMITWLEHRFSHSAILIGDSIHRITLETTQAMSSDDAWTEALRLGDECASTVSTIFASKSRVSSRPLVLRCSQVQSRPEYDDHYRALRRFFDEDTDFRDSVVGFSRRFQHRNSVTSDVGLGFTEKTRRSCEYFLEEFAVFACLVDWGYLVMAYPGMFSTLSEIAQGQHEEVLDQLKQLAVVSLDLKGRNRANQ